MGREALERVFDEYLRDKGIKAECLAASEREVNEFLDALLERQLNVGVVSNSNIEEGVLSSNVHGIYRDVGLWI